METLVRLHNLTAGYNGKIVLHNINLDVFHLDYLGIIGPNGSGKTTLVKVILGLVKPFQGSVIFCRECLDPDVNCIGYLPQIQEMDRQFPISVNDVVLSGLQSPRHLFKRFSAAEKRRAESLMETMGIIDIRHRPMGELSGGQAQRTFLCRAIISSPKLLVLDEPNTFVDKQFETNLFEILKGLNEKMAIILVSHELSTIYTTVKNIACLTKGILHYHQADEITQDLLDRQYECPVDIITHGDIPHRVLRKH
jgi:zinc transport system ATP-binding protein